MNTMLIGVDAGNNEVKLYGELGEMKFPSIIGEYRELKANNSFGKDDMIYEFRNRKGFAGTLAFYESEFAASMGGDSKAHEEALIRVLLGLHRYTDLTTSFDVVVGQPYVKHTSKEKEKITNMLHGTHEITVNGKRKNITIDRVAVAIEGGSAFWSNPVKGKVHILDFGSGTVNGVTLIDGRYIDKDSWTIKEGDNTITSKDYESFARSVCVRALKKWDNYDSVLLCGGLAETMLIHVYSYFPNAQLLKPRVNKPNTDIKASVGSLNTPEIVYLSPIYANAVGFYNIGKKVLVNG